MMLAEFTQPFSKRFLDAPSTVCIMPKSARCTNHQQCIRRISKALGYRFSRLCDNSRSQEEYGEQNRSETFQCWPPATIMPREASQVSLVVCKLASEKSVENQFDSVLRLRTRPRDLE